MSTPTAGDRHIPSNADEAREILRADEGYYALTPDELAFFKVQTGIQNEEDLKKHIIAIQAQAFAIFPYTCIRRFSFTKLKISRMPKYRDLLQLGKDRSDAIFLDIGCCFGNDARKAIADGFPADKVVASDIQDEFWQLGHKLFNSSTETFPVAFVPGDAFDPGFLKPTPPFSSAPELPKPNLQSLTSLSPLLGQVSAIHTSSLFHLFDEDKQTELAHRLAGLLSPTPGSFIFGSHVGMPVKGMKKEPSPRGKIDFCHSPESWKALWGEIFGVDVVKVEAGLVAVNGTNVVRLEGASTKRTLLFWSVTRI